MDEYTEGPITEIRIFDEGDGWALDGVDADGGYTQEVWKYSTKGEAHAGRVKFIQFLTEQGYEVTASRWASAGTIPEPQTMEYRNTL